MNRILLVFAGLILYFAVMAIYANYVGGRRKTDKLGRKVNRTHSTLKALPDRQRKRVEKSLLILEKHPDLRNGIGALVSTRYADQIDHLFMNDYSIFSMVDTKKENKLYQY